MFASSETSETSEKRENIAISLSSTSQYKLKIKGKKTANTRETELALRAKVATFNCSIGYV